MNFYAANATSVLSYRQIGGTRAYVSALGFGGAAIGNLYAPVADEQAVASVHTALECGIDYFDTAPYYGFGLSERRLAAGLNGRRRATTVLSTKVGRRLVPAPHVNTSKVRHGYVSPLPVEPVFDYSYDGVMRAFEDSLARLQTHRVDIVLCHDLGKLTHGREHHRHLRDFLDGGWRALCELRSQRSVTAIGLGVNEQAICETVLQQCDLDCVLLAGRYTLLEQAPIHTLLPLCAQKKVSIIIGGVFNSGVLVAGSRGGTQARYDYEAAPDAVLKRVRQLERVCAEFAVPLAAAALQFPFAHPQVASVLVGCAAPEQVRQARRWLDIRIPAQLWSALRDRKLIDPDAPVPT